MPATQTLANWLEERRNSRSRLRPIEDLFQPRSMFEALAHLRAASGRLEERTPRAEELAAVLDRVRQHWRKTQTLGGISRRDWRRIPWILFSPATHPDRWLGLDRRFLLEYLRTLDYSGATAPVRSLLRVFFLQYPKDAGTFTLLAKGLERLLAVRPQLEAWRERSRDLSLLDPDGPLRFVEAWFRSTGTVDSFLADKGFERGLEYGHFVLESTHRWARRCGEALRSDALEGEQLARAMEWFRTGDHLRFEQLRGLIAEEILSPFLGCTPPEPVQAPIREFFLRCYGDPRLPSRPGWAGIADDIRFILCRWLVGLTLEDFFRLIGKTALTRHWRARRAFWNAYFSRDLISAAWIALGREARQQARHVFRDGSPPYARLEGGGVQGTHSVLLLRIANVTVAEWSHSGTCRFWLDGNPDAPRLYRPVYNGQQLRLGADHAQRHVRSPTYPWQRRIADWIEGQTGIHLDSSEYRVLSP